MFDFKGKAALVTGGTTGIGFATAMMLAKGGAAVAIAGRGEKRGADALAQMSALESRSFFIPCDVSSVSDCRRLVEETVSRLGDLIF